MRETLSVPRQQWQNNERQAVRYPYIHRMTYLLFLCIDHEHDGYDRGRFRLQAARQKNDYQASRHF